MAELSPESAEAGIFSEPQGTPQREQQSKQQKPVALTGKLEVSLICPKF